MERRDCDALVLFGATGDLCYRKIYPVAVSARAPQLPEGAGDRRGRAGWKREQLIERMRDSLKKFVPDADEAVVERLVALVQYVDGDYGNRATFEQLRRLLGNAQHPLQLPRHSAEHVPGRDQQLGATQRGQGRAGGRREALRPRSGLGARAEPDAAQAFPREQHFSHRPLSGQGGGAEPAVLPLRQLLPRAGLEPQLRRQRADHDGREDRRRAAAASSTRRPAPSAT